MTGIDRRNFLKFSVASALPYEASSAVMPTGTLPELLASSFQYAATKKYALGVCDYRGRLLRSEPLPARGHACVFRPGGHELIAFARRPGRFMHILDLNFGKPTLEIASLPDRHFYGHGCFSKNANFLFSTENDFDNARGVIGVYDAKAQYRRIGEFSSFGVGPHEVVLHPDGQTLIVANGGIETHPEYGREKLNLDQMQSSIAYINSYDGRLIAKHQLPEQYQKLSLRHLAINDGGQCLFGAQNNGAFEQLPPLLGSVCKDKGLLLYSVSEEQTASLKNTISSVCSVPNSERFAATSSHGGVILVVDARERSFQQLIEMPDVSGIAASDHQLHCSNGHGVIDSLGLLSGRWDRDLTTKTSDIRWDNHLSLSKT